MTAGRSGTPKVMGILMIIFASIGLLFTLIGLAGNAGGGAAAKEIDAYKTFTTLALVFGVLDLGIVVLHLVAGIQSVRYKANAPKLAVAYGALRILHTVTWLVIVYAWLKPAIEKFPGGKEAMAVLGAMFVIMGIIAVVWPIIVLALMTRPSAKAACTN